MADSMVVDGLVAALARKNRIDDPAVAPVGLEVRTSIGFNLKGDDLSRRILSDRPGCDAFRVVWEYRVSPDDLEDFRANLLSNEPDLVTRTASGPVRYLGTYLVKQAPEDPPLFVTSWGCPDADTALTLAKGPWSGPAGAEDLYRFTFAAVFDWSRAERITSQGLAAAAEF